MLYCTMLYCTVLLSGGLVRGSAAGGLQRVPSGGGGGGGGYCQAPARGQQRRAARLGQAPHLGGGQGLGLPGGGQVSGQNAVLQIP